jgi:hypothetical protein
MKREISYDKLCKIINEELSNVDHGGIKDLVTSAEKLMKALKQFKEYQDSAPKPVKDALLDDVDNLCTKLDKMMTEPSSYVVSPVLRQKVVRKLVQQGKDVLK